MKKLIKTVCLRILGLTITISGLLFFYPFTVYANEPVIVVIDPGHGGENLGAEYDEYTEKDMTMIVARAMKEELEKYDDIIVYLTRESDVDMTIKDRALFAKEKNADFLFCLHFNSSVNHNLYGSEIWVSAFGEYYVKGRQFAEINMDIFEDMGLYSRGIKTRLNDKDDNYYGILRYCTNENVPAALIEHCHLDNEKDKPFYRQSDEQLIDFGRKDAEAVAKYFGLHSTETGMDFKDYPKIEVPYREIVRPDKTAPDSCDIEVLDINREDGIVTVSMHAVDNDSYIQYYSYSLNGGNTYSELFAWPRPVWNSSEAEYIFDIQVPFDQDLELRASAYNGFDVFSESNLVVLPAIEAPEPSPEPSETPEEIKKETYQEITYEPIEENVENKQEKIQLLVLILLISLLMAIVLSLMIGMLFKLRDHSRKHR
ncbi:MAG: hypothetical protein HDR10_00645 [Lachnospiraceae bacterium]|nr:hypothetical protein [Lachnospiraceae bacterium]